MARTTEPKIESAASTSVTAQRNAVVAVDEAFTVAVSLSQADTEAERARLKKQLAAEQQKLDRLEKKLQDERFLSQAKPDYIESTRAEAAKARATMTSIEERLSLL